jgi:peroxiredoxin
MTQETIAQALNAAFLEARDLNAPVNERLAKYAEALRLQFMPYTEAFDRLVARLNQASAGASAPDVGAPMPSFLLPDEQGNLVGLDELLANGPVAVTFLRGHWCPYCRIYAHTLAQMQERVEAIGAQIVAITPERQQYTLKQKDEARAGFKILSDIGNGYALSLNLAIWLGAEMQQLLTDLGSDLSAYQGTASWFVPIPATFVVARNGTITARFVDPDYSRRMDADDLVAALNASA